MMRMLGYAKCPYPAQNSREVLYCYYKVRARAVCLLDQANSENGQPKVYFSVHQTSTGCGASTGTTFGAWDSNPRPQFEQNLLNKNETFKLNFLIEHAGARG